MSILNQKGWKSKVSNLKKLKVKQNRFKWRNIKSNIKSYLARCSCNYYNQGKLNNECIAETFNQWKNVTNCARFVAESVGRIIRRRKCGSRWLSNERRTRLLVLLCVPHVSPASVASISLRPFWQPQLIRLTCLSTPSSHMWSARANIVTLVRYPTAPFFKKK